MCVYVIKLIYTLAPRYGELSSVTKMFVHSDAYFETLYSFIYHSYLTAAIVFLVYKPSLAQRQHYRITISPIRNPNKMHLSAQWWPRARVCGVRCVGHTVGVFDAHL